MQVHTPTVSAEGDLDDTFWHFLTLFQQPIFSHIVRNCQKTLRFENEATADIDF